MQPSRTNLKSGGWCSPSPTCAFSRNLHGANNLCGSSQTARKYSRREQRKARACRSQRLRSPSEGFLSTKIIHHETYAKRGGGRWRHELRGPTLINFMRYRSKRPDILGECTLTAWNRAGALDRSMYSDGHLNDVDWKMLASICRKLQRQIDSVSSAKIGGSRVLPDAFRKLGAGEITLWCGGEELSISSPCIVIKTSKLS